MHGTLALIAQTNMTKFNSFLNKTVIHISRADFLTDGKESVEHFGPLPITFADNSYTMGQMETEDIRGFQLSPQTRILYR
jgi:hypothetical protein